MTTPKDLWRELGNTDRASFQKALTRSTLPGPSPMGTKAVADYLYDVLSPFGLTRLAAAMAWIESKNHTWTCSTSPKGEPCIPSANNNPWAVSGGWDPIKGHKWVNYADYADAAIDWLSRLLSEEGPYAGTRTIAEMVEVYAPGFENDSAKYAHDICREVDAMPPIGKEKEKVPAYPMKEVAVAGSTKPILLPSDIKFRQSLIPVGKTNQRPGTKMKALYYTQHETANRNSAATARMHEEWLHSGAPGVADVQVGFHFVVDDKEIIQLLPVDEIAWHAGDGSGPGNYSSVGCELCVNAGRNVAKAESNAAWLAAGVMRALDIPSVNLRAHYDWVQGRAGAHYCPEIMLTSGRWSAFESTVANLLAGKGGEQEDVLPLIPESFIRENIFPEYDPNGVVTKGWVEKCRYYGALLKREAVYVGGKEWVKMYRFSNGVCAFVMRNGAVEWSDNLWA